MKKFCQINTDGISQAFFLLFCSKRDIPCSNYQMHTAHCARHITLCSKCDEPIPKREFDEHQSQCSGPIVEEPSQPEPEKSVTKVAAVKCQTIASALPAPTSSTTASVPEPVCKYCHLEFPNQNMTEHENYCGSRTEKW